MTKYTTITDVAEQYVAVALQEYAEDFDTDEIAREITEYQDGGFVVVADDDQFWEIVRENVTLDLTMKQIAEAIDEARGEGQSEFYDIDWIAALITEVHFGRVHIKEEFEDDGNFWELAYKHRLFD